MNKQAILIKGMDSEEDQDELKYWQEHFGTYAGVLKAGMEALRVLEANKNQSLSKLTTKPIPSGVNRVGRQRQIDRKGLLRLAVDGHTPAEIAEIMGIAKVTVYTILRQIRSGS